MKILITGGASGLGKFITEKFAQDASNTIYITYCASVDTATVIEKEFVNVKSIRVDFNSLDSIELLLQLISEVKPDILINNAIAGYNLNHFHKMDPISFENSFKVNVIPVLRITQKFIVECRKKKSGKIITILSAGIINKPPLGFSEYTANKAYLHSMVKSWATENAVFGITSNGISPSFMDTSLTSTTDSRLVGNMIKENPNNQILKESEVADSVFFLANATPQINGINLIINAAKDMQ